MDRFRLMKSFVTVARAGSFVAAAKELHVSRSLLSKHIGQLEALLGVQILVRDTHNLSLTELGNEYLRSATHLLEDLEATEAAITGRGRSPHGTLRIFSPLAFGTMFMGKVVADFVDKYPEIHVSVTLGARPSQAGDVVGHSYDVLIGMAPPTDSSLMVRRIAPITNMLCASPSYLETNGEPKSPKDLSRHACIYHEVGSKSRWDFKRGNEHVSAMVPRSLLPHTNSLTILREWILAGKGIGFINEYCVYQDIRAGRLKRVLPSYGTKDRSLYLLFPAVRYLPMNLRLFIDFFAEQFSTPPWRDP
jgi:DNA-binding transcriptional LysR family regulator